MPKESPLTPAQRRIRGRIGAFALHAQHDPKETTRAARVARFRRYEDEVDPDRTLSPEERYRRAKAAERAYMTKLALRRSRARSRNGDVA